MTRYTQTAQVFCPEHISGLKTIYSHIQMTSQTRNVFLSQINEALLLTTLRAARLTLKSHLRLMIALNLLAVVVFSASAQSNDLPRFGLGLTASSLGAGIQAATSVTHSSNVRVGFNGFNYSDSFSKDGINYNAQLKFRSVQATFDQYIKGGFHISPGLLIYDGNKGSANASVPGGQQFSLGNQTYYSSSSSPVSGAAAVTFNKAAPMILIGFGNMLPRSQRHFGLNFDAGVVFEGSPGATLRLGGNACLTSTQAACLNAAADPTVQANVQAEQTKINNSLTPFKFYPVVALTLSYKF